MILPVLSAAASIFFAAAPDTALAYAEALARAERYEKDPKAQMYRLNQLYPPLGKAMPAIFQACAPGETTTGRPNFTVVLSFKAGAFDAIRHTSDRPVRGGENGRPEVRSAALPRLRGRDPPEDERGIGRLAILSHLGEGDRPEGGGAGCATVRRQASVGRSPPPPGCG